MAHGRKILSLVLAGAALVALAVVLVRPISDPDYWWHLRAGKDLVETRQLPTTDPWSLTAELDDDPGGPDVLIWQYPPLSRADYRRVIMTGEWLSQLALYGTYVAVGHPGTTVLSMLCMLAAITLAFGFAWRSGAPAALALLAGSVAAWELWAWGVPRPQLFTYVAATAFVWLFDSLRRGHRRALVLLPLLAVLWSNLHVGYIAGILIAMAFTGGELADRLLKRPSRPGPATVGLLLSTAGFAANPNLLNAIPASFVVRVSLFSRTIAEWQAPGLDRWIFFTLLGLAIVSLIAAVASRQAPLAHAALVLGFGVMGVMSYRHIPLFILLGFPASIAALSRTVRQKHPAFPALRRVTGRIGAPPFQLAALAAALLSVGALVRETRPHGFGTDEEWAPAEMTEHINQLAVPGPVFNEYRFGGYLLWALDPRRQLFIDGRSFSERANWEYDQTLAAQRPVYPFVFDRYDISILALALTASWAGSISHLVLELADDPGWIATFVGPGSAVFVRRSALPDSGAGREDLRPELYRAAVQQISKSPADEATRSGNLAVLYARLGMLDAARMHADIAFPAARTESGSLVRRPPLVAKALGQAAERAGRLDEAMAYYHMAPGSPVVMAPLALLLLRRAEAGVGQISAALQVLGATVAAGTCDARVHDAYDRYAESPGNDDASNLIANGLYLRALRSAETMLAGGSNEAEAEFFRGVALLKLCRYAEAERAFRRSAVIDGGLGAAPSPTLVNLGWALFEGGRPDEALPVFEALVERNPEDTQALYGAGLAAKFTGRRSVAKDFFELYLAIATADDPWLSRARANLAELESYRFFRGL